MLVSVTSAVELKFKSALRKTVTLPIANDVSPAPLIEAIPAAESSNPMTCSESKFSTLAARTKISGSGLPFVSVPGYRVVFYLEFAD